MWTTPKSWATNEVVTSTLLNTHLRDNLSGVLPIGTLILRVAAYSDQEVAVEGRWLQCNGYAVSRTTYADLFAYLNALTPALPFGVGDGVTTFNLPDMRARVPVAEGEHTSVDAIGDSDGVAIANRRPQHRHTPHTHTVTADDTAGGGANFARTGGNNQSLTVAAKDGGSGTSTDSLDAPAYLVFGSYFIKYTN